MKEKSISKNEYLYKKGEEGKEIYVVEEGEVRLSAEGHTFQTIREGEMTGEHSLIFGKNRNVDAICASDTCKLQSLGDKDFYVLLDSHPAIKEGIRDFSFRREFKKALCFRLKRSFPETEKELFEAFQAIDKKNTGVISIEDMRAMLKLFDAELRENDIRDIVSFLSWKKSGKLTWKEFRSIFRKYEKSNSFLTKKRDN